MLLIFVSLGSGTGLTIPIPYKVTEKIGAILIGLLLYVSNIITIGAANEGLAVYFGRQITSKRGYSIAICGFWNASPFQKLTFANELSLSSKCRKQLSRLSYVWIMLSAMKIFIPFSAISLTQDVGRTMDGTTSCIEYSQYGVPNDRVWPNINVTVGTAEYVFGSALGYLRSENSGKFFSFTLIDCRTLRYDNGNVTTNRW
jgi:hypothetical protein